MRVLVLSLVLCAVMSSCLGQVCLPSHSVLKAYFDSNFQFMNETADSDEIDFSYLPTSYRDGHSLEDYVSYTYSGRFKKYRCDIWKLDDGYRIAVRDVTIMFPKDKVEIARMLNETSNLQFMDGFDLNVSIPRINMYGNETYNVVQRIHRLVRNEEMIVVGTDKYEIGKLAREESIPIGTFVNSTVKNEDGFYLHVVVSVKAPYQGSGNPRPYKDELWKNEVMLTGDEYSISKFLGLPTNNSWGSIRCDNMGPHTIVPVTLVGTKYDYILDTGASFVTIDEGQAKELILADEAVLLDTEVTMQVANGETVTARKMIIKELKIGDVELNDVLAVIVENNPKLLGMSALKKFTSWKVSGDGSWLRYKK